MYYARYNLSISTLFISGMPHPHSRDIAADKCISTIQESNIGSLWHYLQYSLFMLISIDATKYDWQIELSRNFCPNSASTRQRRLLAVFPAETSTTMENIFRMEKRFRVIR